MQGPNVSRYTRLSAYVVQAAVLAICASSVHTEGFCPWMYLDAEPTVMRMHS